MNFLLSAVSILLFVVIPLVVLVWAVKWGMIDARRRFHNRHQANIRFRDQQRRQRDERRQARHR